MAEGYLGLAPSDRQRTEGSTPFRSTMIHISNTIVFGFEPALHGMCNPKESWDRSDSEFDTGSPYGDPKVPETPRIGPNDLDLMRRLIIAGPEHRKFLRAIDIWAFIEPDRGCWQEIDTYKIGTVRNSCSTMHKLGTRSLTEADFYEGIVRQDTFDELNRLGALYRGETLNGFMKGDFRLVESMKRILPEGYIQGADYKMSYENALNMFGHRRSHRLPEWRWTGGCNPAPDGRLSLCDWIWSLPYMKEIIGWIEQSEKDKAEVLREEGREQGRAEVYAEWSRVGERQENDHQAERERDSNKAFRDWADERE